MTAKNKIQHSRPFLLASFVCLVLILGMPSHGLSSEYDHHYQNYDVFIKLPCLNSVWQEVPEYKIASSNFTPGKKYLLVINFSTTVNNGAYNSMARVLHGTTPFPDSTFRNETRRTNADHIGHGYHYWTVWTAVANEDIHIEITQASSVSTMVRVEEYEAFALNLDDDLIEDTDWFYQTATHPLTNLSTTWGVAPGIGASITFDGNNDDWMILGFGKFHSDHTSYRYLMRFYDVTTGLDYSQVRYATEDTADYRPHMIMTGLTNVGSNHTVRVEAKADVAANDWSDSKIFALNMDKFKDHWTGYATNAVPITGSWPEVYGKPDYSASLTGNVLIWSQEIADVANNSAAIFSRMTVDGAVVPAGHADSKRELPHGNLDEDAHHRIYLGTLNAGSRDIDIDMYDTETTTAVADIHSMCILSMGKSNEAPTLDWTGDAGYTTDGVDPDSALGGATFEFRVEYTDVEGVAPTTNEVWVDLNDDGTYQADEKFDMSILSGSDYTVGVDFTKSMAIPLTGDGILKYRFYFRDDAVDATGTPTTDHTFTVQNNPPTLDWTGDTGYTADGVDPDTGDSGSSFEFRVEYTDIDDNAPATKELWIDLNDDNDYGDPGEKVDMTLLSGSDYTAGVDYNTSMNINHAGDGVLKYKFNFSDGADSATGNPTTDDSWYVTVNANNIPTLDWTGDTGYTTEGVEPNTGASGSSFEFRVEYTDADGVAPATKEVWVDLNDDNDFDDPGEKVDMTLLSGSDYTLGVDFNALVPIFYVGDGTLKYRFYFSDGQDDATGNPALDNTWYLTVNPNNIPALTWTGDTGYTTDGVEPEVALGGSTFEFRVKYTDADNHPPTVMQVWIDLNDDTDYDDPGEKVDMAKMSGEGDDYTAGVRYDYSGPISFAGDGVLNYRFYFTDGQDDATGDPTSNKTLTVTNNAPTLNWTGDPGFTFEGVEPDSANSGSVFGFRVEFTDLDNQAPATKEVWIDLNDDSNYELGEQFDMIELDPEDTNYQDGKDYFFSKAITRNGDGTLDYQFYFRDSEADATGDPASAHSLVVTALSGEVLEAKTFGGTSSDYPRAVQQTTDGGYVVAANTGSFGTGNTDAWVLKLNNDFSVAWEKTYGGTSTDNVNAMQQTQDDGYILVGKSSSFGGNDFWALKLAANGAVSWQRRYSRSEVTEAHSVQQTPDGGYIVAGYTSSYTNPGSIVIWVMKLNSIGTVVWEYTYDGGDDERAYSVQCTADGGYVLAGTTESFGAGGTDVWVLKLNSIGTIAWQKTYGGTGSDLVQSIQQTTDGGYIVGGRSNSFVPGVTKMWVLKLDATGNVDWQKTYSGIYGDTCNSIQQTADGGYIVAGDTLMGSEMESPVLIWLIKLQPNGDYMWAKTYGSTMEWSPSIQQTSDGGYIAAGSAYSYGAGSTDVWMLRVDANGEIPGCSEMGTKAPIVSDTSVVGQNTNVTPFGTAETVFVTTGTVLDSTATTSVQCTHTPMSNYPPVAEAGDDYSVAVDDLVSLDGSESYDPDGHDPITYLWTIISKPVGSTAVLSDPTAVDPTFTADVVGYYTIELVVTDNLGVSSSPDEIVIGAPDQLPISRTYGGISSDYPASIQQTTDGGYFVAGKTQSFGSGNTDAWMLKLNFDLTVAWEKTFGGTGGDYAFAMQQTSDDGYVFAGNSWSFGEDGFWVVKLDSAGTIDWEKKYSRGNMVEAYSIQQTADGGYIVAGGTRSYGTPGSLVAWVLRLDANGDVVWENTYDGPGNDAARSVQETADGGYIVAGNYGYDFWVLKLASGGTIEWQKTYGGNDNEYAYAVQQTADGGYIVGGESWDFFDSDIWVLKLDSAGNITWKNKYSWSDPSSIDDEFGSIQQTADGGYIIGGHTYLSWDGEEGPDLWIIKIDSSGQVTWDRTYGGYTSDSGAFARQTADGGYVLTGMTSSYGAGYNDVWVLKLDPSGELPSCSAMGTKGALANTMSVTALDTTVVPQVTTYSVSNTTATVIDTSADISLVCMYSPPWNELPVADAGDTQAVFTSTLVTLDGSGSYDTDGDYPLTYDWTIVSKPVGSTAVLSDPTIVNPTFTADLVGDYTIRLVVIDTLDGMSEPSQVVVKAVVPAANPPTVAWTGDPGYVSDGVDPDVGDSGSYFDFRVEYTHPDNYPPTINEVWIDLNDNGTFESFEKLDMGEVDSGDTNYQDGKDYIHSRSIDYAGDGVRKYKFNFHYGGDPATGPPALDDTHYFTVNVPTGPSYYVDGDNESPQPPYDETSNAATSIQEAINYCKQNGDGTGTFYVKKAATPYNQTSTIMMETNTSLKGRDENWNQPTASDYSDCPSIHGDSVEAIRFEGVSNVTLDGLVLTGGPAGTGGIIALDGTVTEVANVTIRNCLVGTKGTTMWSCISLYGAIGATIEGCDIGYGRVGIGGALMNQISPASSPLVVRRNMIHDCEAGMRLYGGSVGGHDITIGGDSLDGNHVFANNNTGIYLQELGTGCNVILDNNNVYENGEFTGTQPLGVIGAGVYVVGPVDLVTIKRNKIYDNYASGVAISYDSSVVVVGADSTVVDTLENIQNLYGNDIYSNGQGAGVVFGNHETPGTLSGNYVVRGNHIYGQRAGVSLRAALSGNVLVRQNEIDANWRGGVEIQNSCDNLEIIENNIHNNSRVGIHTGDDTGTFNGTPQFTNVTIRQNKIHHNGGGSYGGGIDVKHATSNIENNLVYKNHFGGIRIGDYTTDIKSNTVIFNGDVANEKGGGIIFDDLAGAINDMPAGFPTVPFPIQGNISAYNVRAGIRACFYTTDLYRDYNLIYSNNQDFLANWCGTCASPDCTTGGRRGPRTCIGAQLGRGCHGDTPFCCTAIGASGALPGETLIFADPLFEDMGNDDYHLAVGSPAIGAGEGGTDIGAYGGTYPITDSEIPGP